VRENERANGKNSLYMVTHLQNPKLFRSELDQTQGIPIPQHMISLDPMVCIYHK
jgi:hypothetical protein